MSAHAWPTIPGNLLKDPSRTVAELMKKDVRQWLIDVVALSRAEFQAVIQCLPQSRRRAKGTSDQWSAKDVISHLTYWLEVFDKNITALRASKPLIDTEDYLSMNAAAWNERNRLSWKEVEMALHAALDRIKSQVENLSADEQFDGGALSMGGKPFVANFLYELIDHPLHHFVILYGKSNAKKKGIEMLKRVEGVLDERGFGKWTNSSRKKIQKHVSLLKG